jgi:hypothetical protein
MLNAVKHLCRIIPTVRQRCFTAFSMTMQWVFKSVQLFNG